MSRIVHVITGLGDGGAEGMLLRLCIQMWSMCIVISMMDMGTYGPMFGATAETNSK